MSPHDSALQWRSTMQNLDTVIRIRDAQAEVFYWRKLYPVKNLQIKKQSGRWLTQKEKGTQCVIQYVKKTCSSKGTCLSSCYSIPQISDCENTQWRALCRSHQKTSVHLVFGQSVVKLWIVTGFQLSYQPLRWSINSVLDLRFAWYIWIPRELDNLTY